MAEPLKKSAQRVQEAVEALGFSFNVVEYPATTRTAEDAAAAIGCTVGQIAKSLIFKASTSGNGVLVIASGVNRVDTTLVAEHLGEALQRADADFVREQTGFAIGGVAPIGHTSPIRVYMDDALLAFDDVWAAAGRPDSVFRVDPEALRDAIKPEVLRVRP